nr:MAG TPA: hypothetical protein [Caudoviricetes sp.]
MVNSFTILSSCVKYYLTGVPLNDKMISDRVTPVLVIKGIATLVEGQCLLFFFSVRISIYDFPNNLRTTQACFCAHLVKAVKRFLIHTDTKHEVLRDFFQFLTFLCSRHFTPPFTLLLQTDITM